MDKWNSLSKRERILVGVAFPLVFVILFYFYFWQPVVSDLGKLRLGVPEKNATLAWMRNRLANAGSANETAAESDRDAPLLTVIEQVAITSGVKAAIQRVQPGSDGSVEIWFQEVVADQLLRWVDQLSGSGIAVDTATITRASPGMVSARIKLRRQVS